MLDEARNGADALRREMDGMITEREYETRTADLNAELTESKTRLDGANADVADA